MSGETEEKTSGWTVDTWAAHTNVVLDLRDKLYEERDRRYAEVNVEREKALKIKETADLAALDLAREIQTYKDEKANELRSQIERERGTYATRLDLSAAVERMEALIKPLSEYVTGQLTVSEHRTASTAQVTGVLGGVAAIVIIVNIVIALVVR